MGNSNSGKTTLFNLLTGSRQKVGNWPEVTAEKKTGTYNISREDVNIVDLPGIYSFSPNSPDEQITRNILLSEKVDAVRCNFSGTRTLPYLPVTGIGRIRKCSLQHDGSGK